LVARDVVQRRGIAALDVVRQDREDRRRQAFDLDVEPGRQVAAHLVDARLHELRRDEHVGVRCEVHRHLHRAGGSSGSARGARPGTMLTGLLDRPATLKTTWRAPSCRAFGDDGDAGEDQLG